MLFENKSISKCGHDLKQSLQILTSLGIKTQSLSFDSMIASYLLNPGRSGFSLDDLSLDYLGRSISPLSKTIEDKKKPRPVDEIPLEELCVYASEKADLALSLYHQLVTLLEKNELANLFNDVELPLIKILAEMESQGISLDIAILKKMSQQLGKLLTALAEDIYEAAGEKFSIKSPKQLGQILFDKLGLPFEKKTKTGYSTDIEVLTNLKEKHPLPGLIIEYRGLDKLKSTYIDALPKLVNPKTGKIHTTFNQTGTETGRLSSSDPNLQNIPVRTQLGRSIRRAFIPSQKDWKLLSATISIV